MSAAAARTKSILVDIKDVDTCGIARSNTQLIGDPPRREMTRIALSLHGRVLQHRWIAGRSITTATIAVQIVFCGVVHPIREDEVIGHVLLTSAWHQRLAITRKEVDISAVVTIF